MSKRGDLRHHPDRRAGQGQGGRRAGSNRSGPVRSSRSASAASSAPVFSSSRVSPPPSTRARHSSLVHRCRARLRQSLRLCYAEVQIDGAGFQRRLRFQLRDAFRRVRSLVRGLEPGVSNTLTRPPTVESGGRDTSSSFSMRCTSGRQRHWFPRRSLARSATHSISAAASSTAGYFHRWPGDSNT